MARADGATNGQEVVVVEYELKSKDSRRPFVLKLTKLSPEKDQQRAERSGTLARDTTDIQRTLARRDTTSERNGKEGNSETGQIVSKQVRVGAVTVKRELHGGKGNSGDGGQSVDWLKHLQAANSVSLSEKGAAKLKAGEYAFPPRLRSELLLMKSKTPIRWNGKGLHAGLHNGEQHKRTTPMANGGGHDGGAAVGAVGAKRAREDSYSESFEVGVGAGGKWPPRNSRARVEGGSLQDRARLLMQRGKDLKARASKAKGQLAQAKCLLQAGLKFLESAHLELQIFRNEQKTSKKPYNQKHVEVGRRGETTRGERGEGGVQARTRTRTRTPQLSRLCSSLLCLPLLSPPLHNSLSSSLTHSPSLRHRSSDRTQSL
jgi:hypothetical protein